MTCVATAPIIPGPGDSVEALATMMCTPVAHVVLVALLGACLAATNVGDIGPKKARGYGANARARGAENSKRAACMVATYISLNYLRRAIIHKLS